MMTAAAVARPLDYGAWMSVAATEYERLLDLLGALDDQLWSAPTDCDDWTVRDVVAHLAGAAASMASVPELVRQAWAARSVQGPSDLVDRINAVQVSERRDLAPPELCDELRSRAARAVIARRRIPSAVRAVPVPFGPPLGTRSLEYLMGRIYSRDAWMHRVDLARATGRPFEMTPEHDGRIVEDLVAEWSSVHAEAFDLTLEGAAGGHWTRGSLPAEAALRLDAVEFARILSGRSTGGGLLAHQVPF